MHQGLFEHVNMTVSDPLRTAQMLCDLFDWKIRWQGPAKGDGLSVHVGTDTGYLALYTAGKPSRPKQASYARIGAVNHLGILVDDLDAAEQRILAAGIETHSHQEYEPGRRFYFHDHDGIEIEVVSYA